jgi:hypothetical protein
MSGGGGRSTRLIRSMWPNACGEKASSMPFLVMICLLSMPSDALTYNSSSSWEECGLNADMAFWAGFDSIRTSTVVNAAFRASIQILMNLKVTALKYRNAMD